MCTERDLSKPLAACFCSSFLIKTKVYILFWDESCINTSIYLINKKKYNKKYFLKKISGEDKMDGYFSRSLILSLSYCKYSSQLRPP